MVSSAGCAKVRDKPHQKKKQKPTRTTLKEKEPRVMNGLTPPTPHIIPARLQDTWGVTSVNASSGRLLALHIVVSVTELRGSLLVTQDSLRRPLNIKQCRASSPALFSASHFIHHCAVPAGPREHGMIWHHTFTVAQHVGALKKHRNETDNNNMNKKNTNRKQVHNCALFSSH